MPESQGDPSNVDLPGARGVQLGDGGVQVNLFGQQPVRHRPWQAPALTGPVTSRRELYSELVQDVLSEGTGLTTLTTGIEGSGGSGKTMLATMLCHDPKVADRFPGGLLWITVGEHRRGPALATLICELYAALSGERIVTANPEVAGGRLGTLLDEGEPVLLVVDDVWTPEQLAPFMIGGRSCRRLITTRNRNVAPRTGTSVYVDAMTRDQAVDTLTSGVGLIRNDLLSRLVARTGRWPLLLGLANAAMAGHVEAGADADNAARWVLSRLDSAGPTALDMDFGDETDRSHAVAATIGASLELLTPEQRRRYFDLAVLRDDTLLPDDMLLRFWRHAGMPEADGARLRGTLAQLRLVQSGQRDGWPAVGLHDVIGAYLRHRLGPGELRERHELMVRTAAELLPSSPAGGETPWWTLPAEARYFWYHLPYYLAGAGREAERDALVLDLRWVAAKSENVASSVAVEIDLGDIPGETAARLRRELGMLAELLNRPDTGAGRGTTLHCYLGAVPGLEALAARYRPHLTGPQLLPEWPLPDHTRLPSRTLLGHRYGIRDCVFSPDGALIATASHDHTARVWEVDKGAFTTVLNGHRDAVTACAFSPDGTVLATASEDGTARLWDVASGSLRLVLSGHAGPVTSCAFSSDGTLVATASRDHTARCWHASSGEPARTLSGHDDAVLDCAFSPDGSLLATAGENGLVRLWDVASGTQAAVLAGHAGEVTSCAFSPDGGVLATTGDDGTVRVWETAAGRERLTLRGHDAPVLGCAFSPDGALLASGGCDLVARVWDVASGTETNVLNGHLEAVSACAFSPDGTMLATASHDWMLRLWQADTDVTPSPHQLPWEYACAFSPDGTSLATGGYGRTVRIWDTASGEARLSLAGHEDIVSGCAFSPDGALLATSSYDKTVRVWDAVAGTARFVLTGHAEEVTACAFSPDGTLLISAGRDDSVRVWDAATGRLARTLTGHTGAVSACAFSPDGRFIASASHDHTVRLWDSDGWECRAVLAGHADIVDGCAFSRDGALLASVSHDRTCKVWEVPSGRLRRTLPRHTSGVTDCLFMPDGTLVTTEIGTCQLWMWHLDRDEPWCALSVATPVLDLAWHPTRPLLCGAGQAGIYLLRYLPEAFAGSGSREEADV